MFVLLTVRDTIPVAPKAFAIPPATTITDAINKKYANKLIQDKGLALSCFDILTAEDGRVTWGNGLMYYKEKKFFYWPDTENMLTPEELFKTVKANRLYIDDNEPFKFRVESLEWHDIKPEPPTLEPPGGAGAKVPPKRQVNGTGHPNGDAANGELEGEKEKDAFDKAGWKIFGFIGESGLGVMSWWNNHGGEEEGNGDVEGEEMMFEDQK